VPNNGSKVPSPFDVQTIKHLVGMMSRHDLSEIDLRQGDVRIRLRRGPHGNPVVLTAGPTAALTPAAAPAPTPTAPAGPAAEPAKPTKNQITIKSPTPGTFYARPKPEEPAFVQVGTRVTPTTVVCIIEAMKIFNEITADCTGVITEVLADNQQPVEFGQPLFLVDPTG
jgi:acetyl-CoA carboxylase biotin carboxyl carrier protein